MKILIIGDIFGKSGILGIKHHLKTLKEKHNIDYVIANGENVTNGKSLAYNDYQALMDYGIDFFTTGNHVFHNKEIFNYIDTVDNLLRPLNYNDYYVPGKGSAVVNVLHKSIRITNLIGQTYMNVKVDNPFFALEKLINEVPAADIHIIDFHAEASGEKISLATNFDGKITCIVGTHTHVQTVDNRLLPKGTAFITDIGMTGPYDSIIGLDSSGIIALNKCGFIKQKIMPSDNLSQFCAVVLSINDQTNQAESLERIYLIPH